MNDGDDNNGGDDVHKFTCPINSILVEIQSFFSKCFVYRRCIYMHGMAWHEKESPCKWSGHSTQKCTGSVQYGQNLDRLTRK